MTKLIHKTLPKFVVSTCPLSNSISSSQHRLTFSLARGVGLPLFISRCFLYTKIPCRYPIIYSLKRKSELSKTYVSSSEICNVAHSQNNAYLIGLHYRHKSEDVKGREIVEKKDSPYSGLTTSQKVKEAGKDVTYTGVVIIGIAVTGLMFFYIGRELLSSQSPSGVHTHAYKLCQHNTEVEAAFGTPLKTYGETTRRGRRRHVSHAEFEVNGVKNMRMKFYLEGPYKKGTVHLQARKNESGKYEFVYLFVEVDGFPPRTIVIEDNR